MLKVVLNTITLTLSLTIHLFVSSGVSFLSVSTTMCVIFFCSISGWELSTENYQTSKSGWNITTTVVHNGCQNYGFDRIKLCLQRFVTQSFCIQEKEFYDRQHFVKKEKFARVLFCHKNMSCAINLNSWQKCMKISKSTHLDLLIL